MNYMSMLKDINNNVKLQRIYKINVLNGGSMEIKVSVVVPVYNAEKYIKTCVNSIRNQSYKNLEIILIDDGSKDSSPQICDEFQKEDERIKVVHKKNEGAGKSRNRGIEIATGDYILFVDSDDYIKSTLIEKCVKATNGNKDALVMFGIENVTEDGKTMSCLVPYSDQYVYCNEEVTEKFLPEVIFSENKKKRNLEMPACMANFYSMDVIRKISWHFESEKEYLSEDFYSLLKIYKYIEMVFILNEALYCYRHGHESLSSSLRLMNYKEIKKYYNQCMLLCRNLGYNDKVLQNISEPYLSFSITCLKLMALQDEGLKEKKLKMNEILKDDHLYKVLKKRTLKNEKKSRRILYKAILKNNYALARVLIYIQAYRSK